MALTYELYQAQADMLNPLRAMARRGSDMLRQQCEGLPQAPLLRHLDAGLRVFGHAVATHERPDFGITGLVQNGVDVPVREEVVTSTPFCSLLRFSKGEVAQPKVLVVAPMSGHFATLLRDTVAVLLREHDVYITDWHNARDVPLRDGGFGVDDYVAHITAFLREIGPRGHVLGVCQPAVEVLAAVALMAEDADPATPRSMTLMAGPIDTRLNPTRVNKLATTKDIAWFEDKLIATVPRRYAGAGRQVYPGFLQLSAFMLMNLDKHLQAHFREFQALVTEQVEAARGHRAFYDEYLAVMDLPAEFYLETVRRVFQEHELARGVFEVAGRTVRPEAITKTMLLTVEGERDDICGLGQTSAALDLCSGLKPAAKRHHLQTGVGHYGIFSGSRWETDIYPRVRDVIQLSA